MIQKALLNSAAGGLGRSQLGVPRGGASVTPPPGAPPGDPQGVKSDEMPGFPGGAQCAKIPPCRAPKRSYTVSNCTLEWSYGCA